MNIVTDTESCRRREQITSTDKCESVSLQGDKVMTLADWQSPWYRPSSGWVPGKTISSVLITSDKIEKILERTCFFSTVISYQSSEGFLRPIYFTFVRFLVHVLSCIYWPQYFLLRTNEKQFGYWNTSSSHPPPPPMDFPVRILLSIKWPHASWKLCTAKYGHWTLLWLSSCFLPNLWWPDVILTKIKLTLFLNTMNR